ncbi:hypothetical protein [Enterocloster bolteae]|uniref:hypothetical protein n=1 Tax=Enterocloster bolteae TaxID=208479 RepID=UPI001A9BFA93
MEEETPKPTLREQFEQYKTVVTAAISEDAAYRNACGHSDRENAVIEGNAAVRRAVLGSKDMELIRLYSDVPEFRQRLHREVIDETYPKLMSFGALFLRKILILPFVHGTAISRVNTLLSAI